MYGKIFDSIYDGSLAEDWRALVTFQQLIVLCDVDGIVDMTPGAISRRTGIPIEHIKAGIEILEETDPYSRTPDEEGRRIKRLDPERPWGWFIVNHEKYRAYQDADTVRAGNRERKRQQRERERHSDVTECHGQSHPVTPESRHTDTDTDTVKNSRRDASASEPARDYVWRVGVDLLTSAGESDRGSRSFLGRLCKEFGNEAVRDAVGRALAVAPAEPKAWLKAVLKSKADDEPYYGDT